MIAESRCAPKDPLLFFFLGGANLDRRFRYAFTGAKVEYRASEESEEVQVATTSAPGLIEVMSYEEFARNTSPHFAEWITFLMLCMIPLGIPYMMYTNSVAQFKVKSA